MGVAEAMIYICIHIYHLSLVTYLLYGFGFNITDGVSKVRFVPDVQ